MKSKKSISIIAGITVALIILFAACKNKTADLVSTAGSTDTQLDGSGDVYQIDTATSVIEWIGATPSNTQHNGILKLSNGQFTAKKNQLTSGTFKISINSITNLDQTGKDKSNLEDHLKNQDFFEVEKYPFGNFTITQLQTDSTGQYVMGNLTLKGITNNIRIPVKLTIDTESISAETPMFTIDRTKWGIVYNSGIIGTIKDDLISDEISLKLKIRATKVTSKKF